MDKNITVAEIASVVKKDMVNYIGPIFQDLKGEIRDLKTELTDKISRQGAELTDKINWQGTIMEDMRKEVRLALELSGKSFQNESTLKDHEVRISAVETDIKVLKAIKPLN